MTRCISRSALLWSVICCVVARSTRQASDPHLVTKRETTNCSEVESLATAGLHEVKEVHQLEYTFFIKPGPEFRALVFRLRIDNLWNRNGPYATNEKVVFTGPQLGAEGEWTEVQVRYHRHQVWYGRDRHGLKVSVGRLSKYIKSSRWWRTHSFQGFVILVEGPAKLRFGCSPSELLHQSRPVQLLRDKLVVGCLLLGGIMVLLGVIWVVLTLTRPPPPPPSDDPPPVPPLPESLLLKRGHGDNSEATYEEFNEETLLRLRQMLDPDTFASCGSVGSGGTPNGHYEASGDDGKDSPGPICGKTSLLEEKQKAWLENPSRGPAPEQQYLEMHGIINGNSAFGK